jgi:hypothetical protein
VSLNLGDRSNVISAAWSYPYNLRTTPIVVDGIPASTTLSNANDIKPSAEFFVFTGVTSMLLSLAITVLYVLMDRQYRNDERFPIVDFVLSIIWAIFWIAGSSAWAQGVSNIRSQTSPQNVASLSGVCPTNDSCPVSASMLYIQSSKNIMFTF